ncbi:hypothetical protein CDAR_50871 [Caerostris darwini]|uniref:Uncharacterized protein n=1 Tax=Caerostris darwini TaxID=1538125 RepID=A0AAV4U5Y1_9ARAC|nr:hypothetical protein CDAR_50871 [Caerostris darwini]
MPPSNGVGARRWRNKFFWRSPINRVCLPEKQIKPPLRITKRGRSDKFFLLSPAGARDKESPFFCAEEAFGTFAIVYGRRYLLWGSYDGWATYAILDCIVWGVTFLGGGDDYEIEDAMLMFDKQTNRHRGWEDNMEHGMVEVEIETSSLPLIAHFRTETYRLGQSARAVRQGMGKCIIPR